jgi:hypothetical protein
MNVEDWQEQNGRYLSASLHWLRLRMQQLERAQRTAPGRASSGLTGAAGEPLEAPWSMDEMAGELLSADASQPEIENGSAPAAATAVEPAQAKPSFWDRLFGQPASKETNDRPAPPESEVKHLPPNLSTLLRQAAAERAEAAQMQPPPALLMLSYQLGLSEFERDALLLCVALELDTRIAPLCARLQGDPARAYPTFSLALRLFDDPAWDALSPHRPLRYWRLLEINQPGATPLTHSALRADERITNYVKGLNTLDDRLANWLTGLRGPAQLSPSQGETVETVLWYWRHAPGDAALPVAQILGADSQSKRLAARQVAAEMQRQLYGIAADELPTNPADLDLFTRLWQRESLLLPLALHVDAQTHDSPEGWRALDRFLTRAADANGLLLLGVRDAMPELAAASFTVDVARPALTEQRAAWLHLLDDERLANQLASQFNFNLPDILAIADQVEPAADGFIPERGGSHDVWELCRARTRPRLDTLAQRLRPKATWEDLVTPDEPGRLLRAIADQVRQRATVYEDWGFARRMNRGMGISALFAGESGTGKTMAAEVIANDLRLDLYRIDLSAVVSKYIGETEKNLRRLFDAAEDGGAILFFDEADALFGKRSEVKDSHDRYANIEINYLLQRMEAYTGLAILATNMKTALDPAFVRRLRFIVNFPFPTPADRMRMWLQAFPPETPLERTDPSTAVDFDRLARLSLTGGNIHSIVLNAAFLAVQAGTPVTMPLLLAAARTELRKLGKPINEADLR